MPPGIVNNATRCFTYIALKNGANLKRSEKVYGVLVVKKFGKCRNHIAVSVERLGILFTIDTKLHILAGKFVEKNLEEAAILIRKDNHLMSLSAHTNALNYVILGRVLLAMQVLFTIVHAENLGKLVVVEKYPFA